MPESHRPAYPGKIYRLEQAAADGMLVVVRCSHCRRMTRFLAADLVALLDPAATRWPRPTPARPAASPNTSPCASGTPPPATTATWSSAARRAWCGCRNGGACGWGIERFSVVSPNIALPSTRQRRNDTEGLREHLQDVDVVGRPQVGLQLAKNPAECQMFPIVYFRAS